MRLAGIEFFDMLRFVVLRSFFQKFVFLPFLCVCALADVIPPGRGIAWSGGVPGGIPNRTTIFTTLSPGATVAQFQDAFKSCPSNQVIKLSEGVFYLDSRLQITRGGITIRGAGPGKTTLVFTNNPWAYGLVHFLSDYRYDDPPSNTNLIRNWTSGYAMGSTQITIDQVGDAGGYAPAVLRPGMTICLDQLADPNLVQPVGSEGLHAQQIRENGQRGQQQYVRVVAINNGTTLTISPGVTFPNAQAALKPQIWWWGPSIEYSGIEDLTISQEFGPGHASIVFQSAYGCWVKNVETYKSEYAAVETFESKNIEIRDSYFHHVKSGGASTSYGVYLSLCSDSLVENNIFNAISSPVVPATCSGNIVAYNFCTNHVYSATGWMAHSIQPHGQHPFMNLFEGNVGTGINFDFIHGSSSHNTVFRNRFTGFEPQDNADTYPVLIMATNRYMNVIANVLGTPGYHTIQELDLLTGPANVIYRLGCYDNNSTQPGDLATPGTLLRSYNYDCVTKASTTDAIPASLYLSSRPAWWSGSTWPAIGPDVVGLANPIPAQLRFAGVVAGGATSSGAVAPRAVTGLRIVN
jgi:hypothetical protein